ncbi:MAG: hypothetical protein OXR72_20600 [Gemmatimonadota bacterium]|nr:hypothetical protein [Gemmatimonadota bacterium]
MQSIRRLASEFAVCFFISAQASFVAIACIAIMFSPQSAASQTSFSLSADVDGAAGDQGVTSVDMSPEETVAFQVFVDGVSQAQGVEIRFVYDSGQVAYEGADAGDVFPDAQVLSETGTNPPSVSLGIASMGGRAETSAGLVGVARFSTSAAFTGTTIRIVQAVLGGGGQQDTLKLNFGIELGLESAEPSPDFDSDGTVGFSDFVLFASQYGTTAGDGRYDAPFDLDRDGAVGFADFLVLAGQFGHEVTQPPAATPDRDALVALYDATEGHNWTTQTNWLTDNPIDTWHGVSVEGSRVTGLVLSNNNLTGEIPHDLENLSRLDSLKLHKNVLHGTIPEELRNLGNLRVLMLQENQLTGGMPKWLGDLANLETLWLFNNPLGGTIPVELGNLSNLRQLSLLGIQLTGSIPAELGNLESLEFLGLTANQLTGEIPVELGALTNLTGLWLNGNQLSGPIPAEFGNLNNLWALALAGNELTGPIAAELGNLVNLQRLFLGFNKLTGAIPPELGKLSILPILHLSQNSLSGPIPSELGNLSNLVSLFLSDNRLSGAIPSEFGKLTMLEFLEVHNNDSLTGTLPQGLTELTELERFYFDGTSLCAPANEAFQQWLTGIEAKRGANCE